MKKFYKKAIEKMFQVAGYSFTYDEVVRLSKEDPEWFRTYTMTREQEDKFKEWFFSNSPHNPRHTEVIWGLFILDYGLMIKENSEEQ